MAGISEIVNVSPEQNRVNKQDDVKKVRSGNSQRKTNKTASAAAQNDQAQISPAAKQLLSLRTEAKKYVEQVKSAHTLSELEINDLKQKIQAKYYLSADVVDSIVEKLINLPNYFDQ